MSALGVLSFILALAAGGVGAVRPSLRPGRLVAALAGCGRHETPGT